MNQFPIYEDRSGLLDHAACPRLRFLSREWGRGQEFASPCESSAGSWVSSAPHCGGLAPERKSVYLVLGGAVHTGLNHLMHACMEVERHKALEILLREDHWRPLVMEAADHAVAEFHAELSKGAISVPDAATPEQTAWKLREAHALVEGLVLVAGFRLIPNLIERFRVLEVEQEKRFTLTELPHHWVLIDGMTICAGCGAVYAHYVGRGNYYPLNCRAVIFESRADALLEERESGDLFVHSWKTSADYGRQEEMQFKRDVQGLSEAVAIEQHCNEVNSQDDLPKEVVGIRIQGIQMAFLLKGRKYEAPRLGLGDGLKIHYSPITRGWRQEAHGILPEDDLTSWAWSWEVPKVNQKTGEAYQGNLGKGWESTAIFDSYPGGTRAWVMDLMEGKWQPECGDPFAGSIAMPEPWARSDREMTDWLEESAAIVESIHPKAEEARQAIAKEDWPALRMLLNRYFPKNRKSCYSYGGECYCVPICFGPDHVMQDPLSNGFGLRIPHHSLGGENGA